MTFHIDTPRL